MRYKMTFFLLMLISSLVFTTCKKDEPSDLDPLSITHKSRNVSFKGGNDGNIDLTVTGGKQPYIFNWSNGDTTEDINGLEAGMYVCLVTDALHQSLRDTAYITEPDSLKVTHTSVNVTFKGGRDGSIDLTITGGIPPYNFSWSNGKTTEDLSGIKAGTYICQVKDSVNRTVYDTILITEPDKYEVIKMTTDYGNIIIWLYNQTPKHKMNFLKLTKEKFYDSLIFHRVINDFVIQGGDPTGTGSGGPGYDIPAEIHDSLKHVFGAVGAARESDATNPERKSNGSQFYICENSAGSPHLNKKYTVFGIVISGMNVVSTIAAVPTDASDRPITPVYMTKVEIVLYTADELLNQFSFKIPGFE